MFFSSHILSDAETLCSRVAIMAQGRLAATGRISEMVAFQLKGWELVVAGVSDELRAALQRRWPQPSRRSRRAASRSICRPRRSPSG